MQFLSMVTGCVREATGTHIKVLEFQGPTGPEILAPAGGLPRFARKNVRFAHILYHYLDLENVCPPAPCRKMFVLPLV